MTYREDFEKMVIASTSGYGFSLQYVYNTIFELIKNTHKNMLNNQISKQIIDCNIVCEPYTDDSVTLLTLPNLLRFINVNMIIYPEIEDIGNFYVNKIKLNILIPFKNNTYESESIQLNYSLFEDKVESKLYSCKITDTLENSFYTLIVNIADQINVLFYKYGTHHKTVKKESNPNSDTDIFGITFTKINEINE